MRVFDQNLLAAVKAGDAAATVSSLVAGAHVDIYDGDGWPPLLHAAKHGIDVVQPLLDAGADPNAHDDSGYLPLQMALSIPDYEVAKALLAAGADLNAQPPPRRMSPLHAAIFADNHDDKAGGDCPRTRFLLELGADEQARMGFLDMEDVTPACLGHYFDEKNGDSRFAGFFQRYRQASQTAAAADAAGSRVAGVVAARASAKFRLKP